MGCDPRHAGLLAKGKSAQLKPIRKAVRRWRLGSPPPVWLPGRKYDEGSPTAFARQVSRVRNRRGGSDERRFADSLGTDRVARIGILEHDRVDLGGRVEHADRNGPEALIK